MRKACSNVLKIAKVVAVHPESHSVDLVVLDDDRHLAGVKVMSGSASSTAGVAALVKPAAQDEADPFSAQNGSGRDVFAVLAFYNELPVVLGFLYPSVAECLFPDYDRYMNRTASDVYFTVDGKGNAELFHPAGAFVRIAETPGHEDLRGKDVNGKFDPARNADKQVHIHIEQAGGTAILDIAPNGAITISSQETISIAAQGDMSLNTQSKLNLTSSGDTAINASGAASVTSSGAMSISSSSSVTVHSSSDITVSGSNVTITGGVVSLG